MIRTELKLSLPEGIWQTLWFGSVDQLPQSALSFGTHAFFRLTADTAALPAGSIDRILVSMAHMQLLPIGRLVQGPDGALLEVRPSDARQRKRVLDIDLRRDNTELVTRASLPHRGPAPDWVDDPRYDGLLIRAKRTASTPEVLIPCSSLFQFYWGVTSTLSDAVMSGKLEDLERWFYRPERTRLASDGTFTLEVRRQWEFDIAGYLATILADPDAIDAGRRILRQLIAAKQMPQAGEPLRLEVWPPFPRVTRIEGYFSSPDEQQAADSAPLFLTRIVSADLSPNWTALRFYRENDNRRNSPSQSADGAESAQGEGAPSPSPSSRSGIHPSSKIVVTETPSGYGLNGAELPLLEAIKERFPELENFPIEKAPKEEPSESTPRNRPRIASGPWSAIPGSPGLDKNVLQGKLVGGVGAVRELPSEADLDLELDEELIDEQLREFALAFSKSPIEAWSFEEVVTVHVEFLNPYEETPASTHPLFFRLPRTIADEPIRWLYRDPDCKFTKRGICVRLRAITASGRQHHRYVVDLERRVPKRRTDSVSREPIKNGFLVAWLEKPAAAADLHRALRILLDAVAVNRSPSLAQPPVSGMCLATLRHGDPSASRIVSRVLAARDQCSDEATSARSRKDRQAQSA